MDEVSDCVQRSVANVIARKTGTKTKLFDGTIGMITVIWKCSNQWTAKDKEREREREGKRKWEGEREE